MNSAQTTLWNNLKMSSVKYQKSLTQLDRKRVGAYYTDLDLTDILIKQLFNQMDNKFKADIFSKTFFEPCVGSGNFVFSYLKYIHENFEWSTPQLERLLMNIFVCDSDVDSLSLFSKQLQNFVKVFFDIELNKDFKKNNMGYGLIFDIASGSKTIIEPQKYFNISKFDIVITNPPYKTFRAEKKHYLEDNLYQQDKDYFSNVKQIIQNEFYLQGKGVPNLYKLFVEKIITSYVTLEGYIYLLVPQTILKDQSSTEIRRHILNNQQLLHVYNIDEQSRYVDAAQALSAILIKNKNQQGDFLIVNDFEKSTEFESIIHTNQVLNNLNFSIIAAKKEEIKLLNRMNNSKKIKDFGYIKNLRGELDLSINKDSIYEEGKYPLIRGRNLSLFKLKSVSQNNEFIEQKFINNSKKNKYIYQDRIACQQISNLTSKKRLVFSYIPKNVVLGNSCNFIYVDSIEDGIDLYFLLGLLNSDLYDWYFKMYSSNNHINNYELDNMPIPSISVKEKILFSQMIKDGLAGDSNELLARINEKVNIYFSKNGNSDEVINNKHAIKDIKLAYPRLEKKDIEDYFFNKRSVQELAFLYKLSKFDTKVIEGIKDKYLFTNRNEVLNHTSFKLSELDMEMVKSVSPGGNWTEIPVHIAQKSKRLMRIRETGGRTTLYGRLNYLKPSYTITTYFNRPGNGTNIHPNLDRVLTVREAARIQAFPDDYYFYGNKKNKLTQIGNAVPPLMAYQIAKKIKKNIDVGVSLDLFNGAGGMTTGFKLAGYQSALMNDIDEAALITAKINYPQTDMFLGDLTRPENRDYIIKFSKEHNVDIINGGPPCQGFSMAGYRNLDDPRSKLIYDYVEVLKEVRPKMFVFENVQGLLSHNKGNTFKDLIELFSMIGYKVKAQLLDFSDYGIPQKRKRVIIIGVRNDLQIMPEDCFPEKITVNEENKISVFEALGDLEKVPVDEQSFYAGELQSNFVNCLQGKLHPDDYISNLSTSTNIQQDTSQLSLF